MVILRHSFGSNIPTCLISDADVRLRRINVALHWVDCLQDPCLLFINFARFYYSFYLVVWFRMISFRDWIKLKHRLEESQFQFSKKHPCPPHIAFLFSLPPRPVWIGFLAVAVHCLAILSFLALPFLRRNLTLNTSSFFKSKTALSAKWTPLTCSTS